MQLEVKCEEKKERASKESANSSLVVQETQHLQHQINKLQRAAANMAFTAESVHKWLEQRGRAVPYHKTSIL